MEGNEDVGDESRFYHCSESVRSCVAATASSGTGPADGTGRFAGRLELVVRAGSANDCCKEWAEIEGRKVRENGKIE
jgi:hypothetical protein